MPRPAEFPGKVLSSASSRTCFAGRKPCQQHMFAILLPNRSGMVIPICLICAELQPMVRCFYVAATGQPASRAVLGPWFAPFPTTVSWFLGACFHLSTLCLSDRIGAPRLSRCRACAFRFARNPAEPTLCTKHEDCCRAGFLSRLTFDIHRCPNDTVKRA